jgi:hypothetical protein
VPDVGPVHTLGGALDASGGLLAGERNTVGAARAPDQLVDQRKELVHVPPHGGQLWALDLRRRPRRLLDRHSLGRYPIAAFPQAPQDLAQPGKRAPNPGRASISTPAHM